MPFLRPTLIQIVDRIKKDLEDKLTAGSPALRRSVIAVFSRVFGGASHVLHGHMDWIARQIIPDTADHENLERWASIWAITRKAATFAQREVEFTGLNGAVIPMGTELQRSDGIIYTTDSAGTISGGVVTIPITCATAGETGNVDTLVLLQLVSPITGVDNSAEVQATGQVDGEDQETDDSLRERLIFRISNPPQGGAAHDYIAWAKEVSQVTRAWVYPENTGPGTVGLSFVLDNEVSIIPGAPKVAEVQAYIDERRPVTVDFTAFAPVALAANFTIELTPDTTEVREAVEAELKDLLIREAEPGGGILISHIREAVSIAAGETDNIVTVPSANLAGVANNIYVFGTITWV